MSKEDRKQLRRILLTTRSEITKQQQALLSKQIANNLCHESIFLKSHRIALYFTNKCEVDTQALFDQATALGKECFYPILHPIEHNRMWFARYSEGDTLIKNSYGILEPSLEAAEKIDPRTLDIVITPLVGFDKCGNRIGMGGGFYDRTFEFKLHHHHKPVLIGLAYEQQRVNRIKPNSWDVPLDMVVTEKTVYNFREKPR